MEKHNMQDLDDALATLSCDVGARPGGAPALDDVLPVLGAIEREDPFLVVHYEESAWDLIGAFVAAERLCCPEIGWDLQRTPAPQLRISATSEQIDLLMTMFTRVMQ